MTIAVQPPAPVDAAAVRPCGARDLRLRLDGGDGAFDGMSHSGARAWLESRRGRACLVPGLPRMEALDAAGAELPVTRRPPPGIHPGPAVPPLVVAPRAAVSTTLRWVAGPVFDHSRCWRPATLRVVAGAAVLSAPWPGGQVCGEAGGSATFEQPVLRRGSGAAAP